MSRATTKAKTTSCTALMTRISTQTVPARISSRQPASAATRTPHGTACAGSGRVAGGGGASALRSAAGFVVLRTGGGASSPVVSRSTSARRSSNRSLTSVSPAPIRPSHPGTRDMMRPLPPSLTTTPPWSRRVRPYMAKAPPPRTGRGCAGLRDGAGNPGGSVPAVGLPERPGLAGAAVPAVHVVQAPLDLRGRVGLPVGTGGRVLGGGQGLEEAVGAGRGVDRVVVPAGLVVHDVAEALELAARHHLPRHRLDRGGAVRALDDEVGRVLAAAGRSLVLGALLGRVGRLLRRLLLGDGG